MNRIDQLFQNRKAPVLSIYFVPDIHGWKIHFQRFGLYKTTR